MSNESMDRVQKFLYEREKMRGIDQEQVAALHVGVDGREAFLNVSDLRALMAEIKRLRARDANVGWLVLEAAAIVEDAKKNGSFEDGRGWCVGGVSVDGLILPIERLKDKA